MRYSSTAVEIPKTNYRNQLQSTYLWGFFVSLPPYRTILYVGRARRHYAAAALRPPKPLRAAAPLSLRRRAFGRAVSAAAPRGRARIFCALRPRFARVASLPRGLWLAPRRGPRPFAAPRRPYAPRTFVFPLAGPLELAPRRPSVAVWPSRSRARGARLPLPSPPPSRGHGRGGRRARLRGKPPLIAGRAVAATPPFLCGHPPAPPSASGLPRPRFLSLGRGYAARGTLRSASGGAVGCPPDRSRAFVLGLPRYAWHPPLSRGDGTPRSIGGPWWAGCATLLPRATFWEHTKKLPIAARRARCARPSPRG